MIVTQDIDEPLSDYVSGFWREAFDPKHGCSHSCGSLHGGLTKSYLCVEDILLK